jgi:holo-[acyl-carrier protein] synthase
MIKGVGIDIIEIDRVKSAIKAHGLKFLNKIFTEAELNYCSKRKVFRFPEMAARFAAKEAYAKANGTGIVGIRFKEIEIVNEKSGKPRIAISGKIKKNVQVSLSHSENYAVAAVIIEDGNE